MSNTPVTEDDETGRILPEPVHEDGMVETDDDDLDDLDEDGGLTDVGGGEPNERKII